MTLRDRVWDAVLRELATDDGEGFKISDLDFGESKRHTVRRVLREMEDMGWLERSNDRGRIWDGGENADLLLTRSEEEELPEN